MRLLTTLENANEVNKISHYLASQKIENQIDAEVSNDWGSDQYGAPVYKIWIIDEDKIKFAQEILEEFQQDPTHPRYNQIVLKVKKDSFQGVKPPPVIRKKPGIVTLYLIAICSFVYIYGAMNAPQFKSADSSESYSPLYTAPLKQVMLFDFPKAYSILDEIVTRFGIDALKNPNTLTAPAQELIQQFEHTPSWQGIYQEALTYLQTGEFLPRAPLFEKIQEGEFWRFVSPIFLHGDIFHILFNMAWAYVLGIQLEIHLRPFRYILFIILAASFTNTIQYLLGGPNFIGYSGVVCAMLAFIWKRQADAPWEGYQLQKSTFNFMMIFIFGMLALQGLSFLLEASTGKTIGTSIANGAHVSGLVCGYLFAKTPFFTRKTAS